MIPVNIYHCCVQKTGSQWIKAILSDELLRQRTGLSIYIYHRHLPEKTDTRILTERTFHHALPEQCILTPLYMDYGSYTTIPKPGSYRTFSVVRDPRDIVVSWYFSVKYSHPLMGKIPRHREVLNSVSREEGLIYSIRYLKEYGLFTALKSWAPGPPEDPAVKLFRFEELVDSTRQNVTLASLFKHCGIPLEASEINHLLEKYSWHNMQQQSAQKSAGIQGISHYRKGIPGDWRNYFSEMVCAAWYDELGNLLLETGYLD